MIAKDLEMGQEFLIESNGAYHTCFRILSPYPLKDVIAYINIDQPNYYSFMPEMKRVFA